MLCQHGDFYTCNDRFNPGYLLPHKWENCFTVNNTLFKCIIFSVFMQIDKHSWGFERTSMLSDYLTIEELINQIVTTVRLL